MKKLIKKVCRAAALVAAFPFAALALIGKRVGTQGLFQYNAQLMSLLPGMTGTFVRGAYYRMTLRKFGKNTILLFGAVVTKMDASVGDGCGIGMNTTIGLADIGDKAVISGGCSILSGGRMHDFSDPSKGALEADGVYARVHIGEKTFVGDRSVVMANVGKQTVIGAGTVVVKDIPDRVVAVGNPARIIKER